MTSSGKVLAQAVDVLHERSPESLYVHIPFCKSRCFYCDFTTFVAPKEKQEAYVRDLIAEFDLLRSESTIPLKTVFFGGGTPTLLTTTQWVEIMTVLKQRFALADDAEITIEANPGSVDFEKLRTLFELGINRISFGAQSFNDRLLLAIGRLHDADTVRESISLAQRAGFKRMNVDLMFGLPDQSLEDVSESIAELLRLGIRHISAYWLKVEHGTPFADWQGKGQLRLPGEDAEADMFQFVQQELRKHGFIHYEVSNFAVPGEEARHNLVYWHNEPYFAAGVGAHGYVRGERYENTKSLATYTECLQSGERAIENRSQVRVAESMEDTMMLGLRLQEGVSRLRFLERHHVEMEEVFGPTLDRLVERGLLHWDEDRITLTEKAWPIANIVFEEFVGALD